MLRVGVLRNPWRFAWLIVSILVSALSGEVRADISWKMADEGPRAPDVGLILGDDTRTLAFSGTRAIAFSSSQTHAFTAADAFEFDGANWHPVALNTADAVNAPFSLFFSGGRFVATSVKDGQLFFYVLGGNSWNQIASIPWQGQESIWPGLASSGAQGEPMVDANGRVYVPAPTFDAVCSGQACPTVGPDPKRLVSVSLADSSISDEPPLPACYGKLFMLSGQLYLIQVVRDCGGPSSIGVGRRPSATLPWPFFRLDNDHWTSLPGWNLPTDTLISTPNSLWVVYATGVLDQAVKILTTSGLSDPVPLPHVVYVYYPLALEWHGQFLLVNGDQVGNIYQLQSGTFVRMTPKAPVTVNSYTSGTRVFVAGSRLFTRADGWNVFVRGPTDWVETSGTSGPPGADAYFMGATKTFAVQGTRVFRRDESGWTRLSTVPNSEAATIRAVWGDRPVAARLDERFNAVLLAHEPASDSWEDLHVPTGFLPEPMLASGEDLYVGGYPRPLARFHRGVWSVFTASPPLQRNELSPTRIREANGSIYVIGDTVRLVSGDHLTQAFADLDTRIRVDDIAEVGGRLFLLVRDGSRSDELQAVILTPVAGGYQTVVTQEDIRWTGVNLDTLYPYVSLAVVGDTLLFGGLSLQGGQLRAQTGRILPRTIDRDGRFASEDLHSVYQWPPRGSLLVPFPRVRKNLAAVVDTTGFGGVHYRSELTIANFSATSPALARVFAGAGTTSVTEVSLGPGIQTRIEDPIPGFVGPVTVEFDGLSDEQDAWGGVRVWSPSEGGTAGTSIVASNPGDLPMRTAVIPPPATPGSRIHIAFAASGDGAGWNVGVLYYRQSQAFLASYLAIPNGGFAQVSPASEYLAAPLVIQGGSGADDLLGYLVRNEAGTNDGTIVPFEPPDTLPGRRTRFLPAVLATTSTPGRYRTELSLGWRTSSLYPPANLDFSATYRDGTGSWTFPFSIAQGQILSTEDVGSWLAANGVPLNPLDFAGTLTFNSDRPEGAADLLVTAVVLARGPGASGDYGVGVPVINEVQWASNEAIVPCLREDAAFRSNIAMANPEPDGGSSVTLSVSLRRASDGAPLGSLPPVTLAPGKRFQFNRVLRIASYSGDAYAVVSRVAGTGRFVAYGVINDNVTGDGTLFPMTRVE